MTAPPIDPAAEAAFVRGVIAAPDDDVLRLVFADYLDEHGDPLRAEFIRAQCHLATLTPADDAYYDVTDRVEELSDRLHGRRWGEGELPAGFHYAKPSHGDHGSLSDVYRRGFPAKFYATFKGQSDPAGAEAVFAATTARDLIIHPGMEIIFIAY